jgi:hypothetical protein
MLSKATVLVVEGGTHEQFATELTDGFWEGMDLSMPK